ncbi:MAG: benzene 1,2-dioxygenase [Betaproteobacteria bacterium]|nr:benzene 1,2-dioxygenase [Betaproteobacteria bacterium]
MTPAERELFESAKEAVHREGMLLDEQRWDEWLALYLPDCVYWLPMWSEEGVLTPDTGSALSYIYYENRKGLEDRILRIDSRRSPASTPMPRTSHAYSSLLALDPPAAEQVRLRAAWNTHVYSPRANEQHVFFGWAEYTLKSTEGQWKIARKKVVLLNDVIPTMLDVYCI